MNFSGIPDRIITVGLDTEAPTRHIFLIVSADILMLSVKGLSPEDFEQQHLREAAWPAGSPYFVVHQPKVGMVLRGDTNGNVFRRLSLPKAARIAGSGMKIVAMERWLRIEAATRWAGAWEEHLKGLPPLDFDIIQVHEDKPIEE